MRKLYPPDDKLVINVCMSYRHDFGLMSKEEQETLIFECKEWFRAIDNNLNIIKNISELTKILISKIEDDIEKNHTNIWKDYFEIAEITGYDINEVVLIIKKLVNDKYIIKNYKGKYTTRKLYDKYTPYIKKVFDSYNGYFR